MVILGANRGKTVKGEKGESLFIEFKNCQISADRKYRATNLDGSKTFFPL